MESERRIRETEEHYRVEEAEGGPLALVSQGEKAHRFEISIQPLSFHITGRPGTVSRALEDGKRWISIVISELEIGTAADMGYSSMLGSNSSWVIRDGRLKHVPIRAVRVEPLSAHRESVERTQENQRAAAELRGDAEPPTADAGVGEEGVEKLAEVQLGHYRPDRRWGEGEEEIYLEMGLRDEAFDALFDACLGGQVHEVYMHVEVFALSTGSRYEIARDLLLRPDSTIAGEADTLVARFIPEVRTVPEAERGASEDEALDWDEEERAEGAGAAMQLSERVRSARVENTRQVGRAYTAYLSGSIVLVVLTLLMGGSLVEAALLGLLGGVFLLIDMVRRLVIALSVQASVS